MIYGNALNEIHVCLTLVGLLYYRLRLVHVQKQAVRTKKRDLNALRGDIIFIANDSYFAILNAIVVLSHVFHSMLF